VSIALARYARDAGGLWLPEFKPVSGPIIELAADETSSTTRDDIFDITLTKSRTPRAAR